MRIDPASFVQLPSLSAPVGLAVRALSDTCTMPVNEVRSPVKPITRMAAQSAASHAAPPGQLHAPGEGSCHHPSTPRAIWAAAPVSAPSLLQPANARHTNATANFVCITEPPFWAYAGRRAARAAPGASAAYAREIASRGYAFRRTDAVAPPAAQRCTRLFGSEVRGLVDHFNPLCAPVG